MTQKWTTPNLGFALPSVRRSRSLAVAIGLLAIVAVPQAAYASSASMAPTGVAAGITVTPSPAGCFSQTDNPHSSNGKVRTSHGPYVSVHGRTECRKAVTSLSATTSIYRNRWYGEQLVLTGKTATSKGTWRSNDSTPHYLCSGQGTYTYIGYTTSSSIEGGKTYYALSRNANGGKTNMNRFDC
jgi:hypothetical protein